MAGISALSSQTIRVDSKSINTVVVNECILPYDFLIQTFNLNPGTEE